MSDVMLYGILRMPYEMAMNDELSRFQFYQRAQQALDRISELEKDLHMIQRHYDQLDTHPVKELHLSLQKSQDGELLAVTYTDDEHRIVEVLWQKSPVKELTDEIEQCTNSDSWNCKYCRKTEICKALKDPRNFGVPK